MTPTPTPSPLVVELLNGTTSQASYVVPLIAGLFLIAGTLIGALISWLSSRAGDRRKFARENDIRWHQDVRGLTAEILSLSNQHRDTELELFLATKPELSKEAQSDVDELQRRSIELLRTIQLKNNEINIIAPKSVSDRAVQLLEYLVKSTDLDLSSKARDDASEALPGARNALIQSVREYLDLPSFDK